MVSRSTGRQSGAGLTICILVQRLFSLSVTRLVLLYSIRSVSHSNTATISSPSYCRIVLHCIHHHNRPTHSLSLSRACCSHYSWCHCLTAISTRLFASFLATWPLQLPVAFSIECLDCPPPLLLPSLPLDLSLHCPASLAPALPFYHLSPLSLATFDSPTMKLLPAPKSSQPISHPRVHFAFTRYQHSLTHSLCTHALHCSVSLRVPVTFIDPDGHRWTVAATVGDTILQTAEKYDIPLVGECGGGGWPRENYGEGPMCRSCMVYVDNTHIARALPMEGDEERILYWVDNSTKKSHSAHNSTSHIAAHWCLLACMCFIVTEISCAAVCCVLVAAPVWRVRC